MGYCLQCGTQTRIEVPKGDNRKRAVCPNCHYIHYENPKIICGSLVVSGDKILLCKRAIEARYSYWTLPAGFMELDETLDQGAARETVEEAQALVVNQQLYCIYNLPYLGQVYMLFRGELDGGYGAGQESLECGLYAEDEIPWDELAFRSIRRTIEHYYADRKTGHFGLHVETLHRKFEG